jgi:Mlc titration factor MtfA (ptsG expression regulator)
VYGPNRRFYANTNAREYFAVTTEALGNAGAEFIGKWPETRAQFQAEMGLYKLNPVDP